MSNYCFWRDRFAKSCWQNIVNSFIDYFIFKFIIFQIQQIIFATFHIQFCHIFLRPFLVQKYFLMFILQLCWCKQHVYFDDKKGKIIPITLSVIFITSLISFAERNVHGTSQWIIVLLKINCFSKRKINKLHFLIQSSFYSHHRYIIHFCLLNIMKTRKQTKLYFHYHFTTEIISQ